jgi:ferredoxin
VSTPPDAAPAADVSRVEIDPLRCRASGTCARTAPAAFTQSGRAAARVAPGALDHPQALLDGARACPHHAIRVFDPEGRRLHP